MRSFALVAPVLASAATASAAPPHILFIVSDDLGFDDVGFRSAGGDSVGNGAIRTPNIDSFAASGAVLDAYYVQDVCSPSRATFMTGRFAMHHTIVDWIPPASAYGLPLNETTMADTFKKAGYDCHAVGKWHLGFYKWGMTPTFRGFDSYTGFYSGGEDYSTHVSSGAYDMRRDPSPRCGPGCSAVASDLKGVYSTTAFTSAAVAVVEKHAAKAKAKAKAKTAAKAAAAGQPGPLFLYLAYQGVHAPAQAPQHYVDAYAGTIADPKRRTFAGMLSAVDEGIGNVTGALKAAGMWENTLVVFTSDNGGPTTTGDGVGARNWPLRGGKHSIWEGGVRATGVIAGKGVGLAGGTEFKHLMHGADWLPTLAAAAGIAPADVGGSLPLDGVSQWAALSGAAAPGAPPRRTNITLGNSTNMCAWKSGDPRRARYEVAMEGGGHTESAMAAATGGGGAGVGGGAAAIGADYAVNAGSAAEVLRAQTLGCGFAIRADDLEAGRSWKLIRGFGGGPDTWCNTSKAPGGNVCDNSLVPPPSSASAAAAAAAGSSSSSSSSSSSGGSGSSAALACSTVAGVCFPKDDLRNFKSNSTDGADCCAACAADAACAGWTHNAASAGGPGCWLKTSLAGDRRSGSDCISGTNGAAPVPAAPTPDPTPPPAPGLSSCPNGYCLYDTASDPHERTEVSALHGDIVAAMIDRMDAVLLTYKQYEIDASCGPATHGNDSVVGKTWEPWCGID